MKYEDVCRYAEEKEVEILLFNNPEYRNSIVGVTTNDRVVYDLRLMIEDLMTTEDMSYDDALDFIEYNTIGALSSQPNAPIIIQTR